MLDVPQRDDADSESSRLKGSDTTTNLHAPSNAMRVFVLGIFVLLGVGVLLPWNAMITAYDYWNHFYPDFQFLFALGIAYNWPCLFASLASVWLAPKFSFLSRLFVGFSTTLVTLVLVPILTETVDPSVSLYLNLVLTGILGAVTGFLFCTVTSLAVLFPGNQITAVMVGNGVAGVAICGIRILTKATLSGVENSYSISGALYFSIGAFVLLLCVIGSVILLKMKATHQMMQDTEKLPLLAKDGEEGSLTHSELNGTAPPESTKDTINASPTDAKKLHGLLGIIKKSIWFALLLFVVFFVTLSIFPGVTTLIPSSNDSLGDWFPVILITLFNVFDFIGRSMPNFELICVPTVVLSIMSYLRLGFFVLFVLSAMDYMTYNSWSYIMVALMGLSNGYCGTLALKYAPTKVEPHEMEVAGTFFGFALQFGIFCGCNFAMLLLYLITGSVFGPTASSSSSSNSTLSFVSALASSSSSS
ncbi:equilibrative nucleoside transporter [Pelomyxa schiedti]|nr:equilibrative nucleoside transporter [Pelomyxa schiedti]